MVTFTVIGTPVPKGSFRAYTYRRSAQKGGGIGARATNDNPKTSSWQARIAFEARLAMRRLSIQFGGAVDIRAVFYMPRPKSLAKSYQGPHLVKPDLDKLQRALFDALKDVLFTDDSQVVHVDSWKHYAALGTEPRAEVTVTPVATSAAPLFERTATHGSL
jgi:crossover junction endodeoxyribonuclease RusA